MAEQQQATADRISSTAAQVLREIIHRMGFGDAKVEAADEGDRILLEIVVDDEQETLVGNKGEVLDALQFLVGRMVNRQDTERRPIVVDTGGYRQRRIEALTQLALRLGDKVVRSGKTLAVNPMSAHDRRIIHMTLRDRPGVTTRSEGEGPYRRLLIEPERG